MRRLWMIIAALWFLTPALAQASPIFTGQVLHLDWISDTSAILFSDDLTVGGGVEVPDFPQDPSGNIPTIASIDINDAGGIEIQFLLANQFTGTPPGFNGLVFSDSAGTILDFTALIVEPTSTFAGFDASRVSVTPDSFSLNFAGLPFGLTSTLSLTVVPEPGVGLQLLLGLGLLAVRRRPTPPPG